MEITLQFNSDMAMQFLADRVAQLERDNAIYRAAVMHYQSVLSGQAPPEPMPETFATVPYSENGA